MFPSAVWESFVCKGFLHFLLHIASFLLNFMVFCALQQFRVSALSGLAQFFSVTLHFVSIQRKLSQTFAKFACFKHSFFLVCHSVFYKPTLSWSFIKWGHTVENSPKTKMKASSTHGFTGKRYSCPGVFCPVDFFNPPFCYSDICSPFCNFMYVSIYNIPIYRETYIYILIILFLNFIFFTASITLLTSLFHKPWFKMSNVLFSCMDVS